MLHYYTQPYTLTPDTECLFYSHSPRPHPWLQCSWKCVPHFKSILSISLFPSFLPICDHLAGFQETFFFFQSRQSVILELHFTPQRSRRIVSIYVAVCGSNIYPAECHTNAHMIVKAKVWGEGNIIGRGVLFQRAIFHHSVPYDMGQADKPRATVLTC